MVAHTKLAEVQITIDALRGAVRSLRTMTPAKSGRHEARLYRDGYLTALKVLEQRIEILELAVALSREMV